MNHNCLQAVGCMRLYLLAVAVFMKDMACIEQKWLVELGKNE